MITGDEGKPMSILERIKRKMHRPLLSSDRAVQPDVIHFTRGDYGAAREVAEADRYLDAVGAPVSSPSGEPYSVCGRIVRHQASYSERIKELETLVEAKESTIMAVVHTVGGMVEGAPTHRVNFLQRLNQLMETEARSGQSQLRPTTECPDGTKHVLRCIRCEVPA